jgi:hypothetical protein
MVIGRGRRREHPNQHFVLLLLNKMREKKYGKSTEKKYGNKKVRGKVREKVRENTGEK